MSCGKILPEKVKARLARRFKPRRRNQQPQKKVPMSAEMRQFFVENGRRGGEKTARKRKDATRKGGLETVRAACEAEGVDFDSLPDAPKTKKSSSKPKPNT